jgi:two-component system, NtrC family, sensor histidine kinase PilS
MHYTQAFGLPDNPAMLTTEPLTTIKLFRVYNHYRVVVGITLLISLLIQSDESMAAFYNPWLFKITVVSYAVIHIFTLLLLFSGYTPNTIHVVLSVMMETIIICGMLMFGTGVSSGLGNMTVITVAASNILLRSQLGLLMAAAASMLIMGQEIFRLLESQSDLDSVFRAGVLGVVYFATAILVRNLSYRINVSEDLARRRAQNIAELERLNHQIIQRMLTGIIVTNEVGQVTMANEASLRLLGTEHQPKLTSIPAELLDRLNEWLLNPDRKTAPFRGSPTLAPVQASFAKLQKEQGQDILVFLEDTGKIAQQAQQLKLASLGRLTAGIAHELRNPLGAASHAAQLLVESEDLNKPDRSMAEIIIRHAERMNSIIENVLQLSRGKVGEPESLELEPWLQNYISDFTAAGTRRMEIDIKARKKDIVGRFDPSHLGQVMNNLLSNGIRYSEVQTNYPWAGVEIDTIGSTQQAIIDVLDVGPGIEEEQMANLFEPFYTTDKKGTGLGLYLSKELCEANQAQLDYFRRDEGGSRFRITFPHPMRKT